jgi:hypothetical protein
MKKIRAIIFAGMLLFSITLVFSGCSSSSQTTAATSPAPAATTPSATVQSPLASQSTGTVAVSSADKSVTISVPSGWNTNDLGLYPGAIIGVADNANNEWVIITKKPKSEFGANSTISTYMNTVKDVFSSILTNPVWGPTSNVTIGGCSGVTAQLTGTRRSNNSSTVYYVNALASKNYYYNVCGYTLATAADANKAKLQNIINSFKETD